MPKMVDRFATLGKAGLSSTCRTSTPCSTRCGVCKFTAFAMKEDYYARQLTRRLGRDRGAAGAAAHRRAHLERSSGSSTCAPASRAPTTRCRRACYEPVPGAAAAGGRLAADARRVLSRRGRDWTAHRPPRHLENWGSQPHSMSPPLPTTDGRRSTARRGRPEVTTIGVTVKLFAGLRDLFGQKEFLVAVEQVSDMGRLLGVLCATSEQRQDSTNPEASRKGSSSCSTATTSHWRAA